MKSIVLATAAAAVALAAAPAVAQTQPVSYYGTLGYSQIESGSADLGAITARGGARFGQYLGAELEGALGVDGDAGVDVKHSVAAYAVGFVPLTPQFDLVARVGFGSTRTEFAGLKSSDESWNYGLGGQYFFDANNGLRAEYTRYDFTHDLGKADVWTASYIRKF